MKILDHIISSYIIGGKHLNKVNTIIKMTIIINAESDNVRRKPNMGGGDVHRGWLELRRKEKLNRY